MKERDLQKSIFYLKKMDVKNVSEDIKIMEIANEINKSPSETYKILISVSHK